MSRVRPGKELKGLQRRASKLQQQLQELAASRRALSIRNGLLVAMCDCLCFLQIRLACGSEEQEEALHQEFQELLETEIKLLQQLSTKSELIGCQPLAQLLQPEPGIVAIAPCTDPMFYMKRIVSLPHIEGAATITAGEVANVMREVIKTVSIKLHQADACLDPSTREGFMTELAAACDRYWHCMASLTLLGRHHVVEQTGFINLETGVLELTKASQHQQAQVAALLPSLGLSEQQQELIACGTQLYCDLLASIHREKLEIHTAMTAAGPRQVATSSNTDSSSMDVGASSGTSSSEHGRQLPERQELLEKQQQLTDRLSVLLRKEFKLRVPFLGWLLGTLSYTQMARLAVVSFPYAMRPLFLAMQIMQRWQQLSQSCGQVLE